MNENKLHKCNIPDGTIQDNRKQWGSAIDVCEEFEDKTLWCFNDEYGSQVNFCPVCGYEAKLKINNTKNK